MTRENNNLGMHNQFDWLIQLIVVGQTYGADYIVRWWLIIFPVGCMLFIEPLYINFAKAIDKAIVY